MSKVKSQKLNVQRGFGLLEMVVYISIMTLILVVVVNTLLVILFSQRDIKNLRISEQSSIIALDRLTREIRDANSVELTQSQFGTHPGRLTLNTTDELGAPKTVEFFLEDNILKLNENGVLQGPLTNPQVKVTNLIFYNLSSGSGRAVKVGLTLEAGAGEQAKSENFYSTTAFRGF